MGVEVRFRYPRGGCFHLDRMGDMVAIKFEVVVEVACDAEGCGDVDDSHRFQFDGTPRSVLLEMVRDDLLDNGWAKDGGKWLCPFHAKEQADVDK